MAQSFSQWQQNSGTPTAVTTQQGPLATHPSTFSDVGVSHFGSGNTGAPQSFNDYAKANGMKTVVPLSVITTQTTPTSSITADRWKNEGVVGKTADVANLAFEGFSKLPPIQVAGAVLGAPIGAVSSVLTGVAGGAGQVIHNMFTGKSLFENFGSAVSKGFHEGYSFGSDIGKNSVAPAAVAIGTALAAPAVAAGATALGASEAVSLAAGTAASFATKVADVGLAAGQVNNAVQETKKAIKTNDPQDIFNAGVSIAENIVGAGLLGLHFTSEGLTSKASSSKENMQFTKVKPLGGDVPPGGDKTFPSVKETPIQQWARDKITEHNNAVLRMNPKQIAKENMWSKDTPEFLSKQGIILGKDVQPAIDTLKTKAAAENEAFGTILKNQHKYLSLNEAEAIAKQDINTDAMKLKGTEFTTRNAQIEREFTALRSEASRTVGALERNGDVLLPLDQVNTAKQGFWNQSYQRTGCKRY